MEGVKFNPRRSFSILTFFLVGVWETVREERLKQGREVDDLCDFVGCLHDDLATQCDWERCCQKALGRFPAEDELFTPEEIFTSMIELCAHYRYEFEFSLANELDLLHSMRAKPEQYKKEWDIWQKEVQLEIDIYKRPPPPPIRPKS